MSKPSWSTTKRVIVIVAYAGIVFGSYMASGWAMKATYADWIRSKYGWQRTDWGRRQEIPNSPMGTVLDEVDRNGDRRIDEWQVTIGRDGWQCQVEADDTNGDAYPGYLQLFLGPHGSRCCFRENAFDESDGFFREFFFPDPKDPTKGWAYHDFDSDGDIDEMGAYEGEVEGQIWIRTDMTWRLTTSAAEDGSFTAKDDAGAEKQYAFDWEHGGYAEAGEVWGE